MLRSEMERAGATLWLGTDVGAGAHDGTDFRLTLRRDGAEVEVEVRAQALVLAIGGLSLSKMGASGLAYRPARQFGLRISSLSPLRARRSNG